MTGGHTSKVPTPVRLNLSLLARQALVKRRRSVPTVNLENPSRARIELIALPEAGDEILQLRGTCYEVTNQPN